MKKRMKNLLLCAFAVLIILTMVSCGNTETNTPDTGSEDNNTNTDVVTEDIYVKLNALLAAADYPATVTTKTTEDGHTLNGSYAVTKEGDVYSVDYSYEKLSLFTFTEGGDVVAPDAFKTTYTGRIKVQGGKIIEKDGAEADLSVESLTVKGITLSQAALSDETTEDGLFSAKIDSLKTVTGSDVTATAASIEISYSDTKITKIVLRYVTSAYQTEIVYLFG